MPEIQRGDHEEVAFFLRDTFTLSHEQAQRYASLAVFLSDTEEFQAGLKIIDGWLLEIWSQGMERNLFSLCPDGKNNYLDNNPHNTTSRLLLSAANSLGWLTYGSLVMSGFTHPPDFVKIVKRRLLWKDMVASNHGEYTHTIQWLVIYSKFGADTLELYENACDYKSKLVQGKSFSREQSFYLWDFIVDCFAPGDQQVNWKTHMYSNTARAAGSANKIIMDSDTFIGERLSNRYKKRDWARPGTLPTTATAPHGHKKHMPKVPPIALLTTAAKKTGFDESIVLTDQEVVARRKIFEADRGYKGLQTTGARQNSPKHQHVEKSGYLFARRDNSLLDNAGLPAIAMQTKPFK